MSPTLLITILATVLRVSSPDGQVCAEITISDGVTLSVSHGDDVILKDSRIDLNTNEGEFGKRFKIKKAVRSHVDETFDTPLYKRSQERSVYNELLLKGRDNFDLVLRAFDEGFAWRFVYTGKKQLMVFSEQSNFRFEEDLLAYVPYVRKTGDFSVQFFNTFENTYSVHPVSKWRRGQLAFLPILFDVGEGKKFCITESELEHYPGMYLMGDGGNCLHSVFAPYPKTMRQGSHDPSVTTGGHNQVVVERESYIARLNAGEQFPWRVVAIGKTDAELLDNNLVYKLARPIVQADFSWVKPGKLAWDWWNDWNITGVDFVAGVNNASYKYYIDFAASHGIPYVVLDEGWYDRMAGNAFAVVPEINLPELIEYADSKDVGLMLWVSYYAFQKDMERIISDYARMGIKGFKLDAIGRDDQLMNEFYYKAAALALENKVILDFHGGAKPTGLNRTYPNVLNFEGVHGLEQLKNPNYDCDMVTYDLCFPFIRSIAGPVDYTQGAMRNGTKTTYRSVWSEPMSQGTRCRQIAEYVVFESPLCMLCDTPTNYIKEEECTRFICSIPTVWNETRVIEGKIGDYITIARKSYDDVWYVGSIASWDGRKATLDLSFLEDGKYQAEIFKDGINASHNANDYKRTCIQVCKQDRLEIEIAPGGGYIIRLKKI